MTRRVPVKTALVGLLVAPAAVAQQPPDQSTPPPDPTQPPTENKPADPNAAPFYRAMGAEWVEEVPTSWPGWALQMFRFDIPPAEAGGPAQG